MTSYTFTGLFLAYFPFRLLFLAAEKEFDLFVLSFGVVVDVFGEIVGVVKDDKENVRVASQYSGPVPQ